MISHLSWNCRDVSLVCVFVENSPGLDLNFEKLRRDHTLGVCLTPQAWRAFLYSEMPGGETLHNLVARCRDLLDGYSDLSREECARVTLTMKRYQRRTAFTGRVVYALRLDDSLMEDETRSHLRKIVYKQELFPHLRIYTPLSFCSGFKVSKSIGPERIVGKWSIYLP